MQKTNKRNVISVIILAVISLLTAAWVFGVWIDQCGFGQADVGWSSWHTDAWDVAMPVSAVALGFFSCILFKGRGKIASLLYSLLLSDLLCALPYSFWEYGEYLTVSKVLTNILHQSLLGVPPVLSGFIVAQSIIYMREHFAGLKLVKGTDKALYTAGVKKTVVMAVAVLVAVIATVCLNFAYSLERETPLLTKVLHIISYVLFTALCAVLSALCKGRRKLFVILSVLVIYLLTLYVYVVIYDMLDVGSSIELLLVFFVPFLYFEAFAPVITMAIGSFASIGIGALVKKFSAKKDVNGPQAETEAADASEM